MNVLLKSIFVLLLALPLATFAAQHETKEIKAKAALSPKEQYEVNTALVVAVREKDLAGVEAALKRGANIMTDIETPFDDGPLSVSVLNYIAAQGYHNKPFEHAVINLFFAYNKLNSHNLNMLMETNFVLEISDEGSRMTPFQICVISEDFDLVKKAIANGADVNKLAGNRTPLMVLLVGNVINEDSFEQDPGYGQAAYIAERERNRDRIAQLLVVHGALIEIPTNYSSGEDSELDLAIRLGHTDVVKRLLKYKAPFKAVDGLIVAVKERYINIVDLLLNFGLNPNGTSDNYNGETSLIAACKGDEAINISIIEKLLAAGADPLLEDNQGRNAGWYLAHVMRMGSSGVFWVPVTVLSPERLKAAKLLNEVVAKRLNQDIPVGLPPGVAGLMAEWTTGDYRGPGETEYESEDEAEGDE